MIPCRRSTKCENKYKVCTIYPKLVHALPPSVELWKLRFYKLSSYSVLRKVLKKLLIKKNSTPPQKIYLKRLANDSNINTFCLLYDIRKTFKIRVS